jgi:hypothetical protein
MSTKINNLKMSDKELFTNIDNKKYSYKQKIDRLAELEKTNPKLLGECFKKYAPQYYIADGRLPNYMAFTLYKKLKELHNESNNR